jgi:hypothetical protein
MATGLEGDFFSTAAQVVPFLALIGMIEERKGWDEANDGKPSASDAIGRLLIMAALVLAEVAALTALAGRPTPTERKYVIVGLCTGGLTVAIRFIGHEFQPFYDAISNRWVRVTVFALWWAAIMAALLVPLFAVAF